MTASRRDPEVARWLRVPIWWLLGITALGLVLLVEPVLDLRHQAHIQRVGVPVSGTILGSWDGGRRVPVSFSPPGGGDQVTATAWGPGDADQAIGPVRLQVDPDDAAQARLAGPLPTHDLVETAILLACVVAALAAWLVTRHRCVRRSERLAASDHPAYRMVGVPVPGRFARRRWRLHLYPLDVAPGAAPVCTVPVIGSTTSTTRRLVEVKGEPRPGGSVVAIDPHLGRIWWPAGRVLVTGRTPLPEPDAAATGLDGGSRWWLLGVGVLLIVYSFAFAEDPRSLEERSETTTATVIEGHGAGVQPTPVRYVVDRTTHGSSPSLAGPQRAGDRVVLAYDPEAPSRTWQPGTDAELPGSVPPGGLLALYLGIVCIGLGVVFARPPTPDRWGDGRGRWAQPLR